MKVTQIVELSKSKSKVYIDYEFAFVLYKGELRRYHLKEGEEILQKDYEVLMEDVLPKRAKLRCMNLLMTKEYTVEQLKRKLRQGLYSEEIIEIAISYVASFNYVNDLKYAIDFITYNETSKSKRRIEQDLFKKGISKDTIQQAWDEWQEQGGEQDEIGMIRKQLEKKHYNGETADYKEKQKIYGFLLRKGYSSEQIRKAIDIEDTYL